MAAVGLAMINFNPPAPGPAGQDDRLEPGPAGECFDEVILISSDDEDDEDTDDSQSDADFPSLDEILASGKSGDSHPASCVGSPASPVPAPEDAKVHQPAIAQMSNHTGQERDPSTPQPTSYPAACGASPGSPSAFSPANPPTPRSSPPPEHRQEDGHEHSQEKEVHAGDTTDATCTDATEGHARASSREDSAQLPIDGRRVSPPSMSRNCNEEVCGTGHTDKEGSTASPQRRPHAHPRNHSASRRTCRSDSGLSSPQRTQSHREGTQQVNVLDEAGDAVVRNPEEVAGIDRKRADAIERPKSTPKRHPRAEIVREHRNPVGVEDYSPPVEEEQDEEDETRRPARKRRKADVPRPRSSNGSTRRLRSGGTIRRPRTDETPPAYGASPSPPNRSIPSPPSSYTPCDEGPGEAVFAEFEEWPLENVSLKRVIDSGRAIFQLQFTWEPCKQHGLVHHGHDRASGRRRKLTRQGRASKFTEKEDCLLRELKEGKRLPWQDIHRQFTAAFRGRSLGTLQVHYCTKLKGRHE